MGEQQGPLSQSARALAPLQNAKSLAVPLRVAVVLDDVCDLWSLRLTVSTPPPREKSASSTKFPIAQLRIMIKGYPR